MVSGDNRQNPCLTDTEQYVTLNKFLFVQFTTQNWQKTSDIVKMIATFN